MKNFFKINRALVAKKKFFTLTLALMATITLWAADVAISVTFNSSNKPQNGLTLTSGNVDYGTVSCNAASSNRAVIRDNSSLTFTATVVVMILNQLMFYL